MRTISVANAQGFWGDRRDAAGELLRAVPTLDFLTLDYLAEVSLSIMAIQREKDPAAGYARDFLRVVKAAAVAWKAGTRTRIVTNAGGLNPRGAAEAVVAVLKAAGVSKRVALVEGDDVLPLLQAGDGAEYADLDNGESLDTVRDRLATANAYLGADAVAEALDGGADVVVTGRVADPSLTVGPCRHAFGWSATDYDLIAAAAMAGHLIECGAQATGGLSAAWADLPGRENLGFPIATVAADGRVEIGKPPGTGGLVSVRSVTEQLLYELGDPAAFLTPDATIDLRQTTVERAGPDRVAMIGVKGSPPPPRLKVSATYCDGFRATGYLTVVGPDAVRRARAAGQAILDRLAAAGRRPADALVECLGAGDAVPGVLPRRDDLWETVLRVSVSDPDPAVAERFAEELAPLVTGGPPGVTGYAEGKPAVRPVFGYWPCLIRRKLVAPRVAYLDS